MQSKQNKQKKEKQKKDGKRKGLSLRSRLLMAFIGFTVLFMVLLFVVQTVYLGPIYRMNKTRQSAKCMAELSVILENKESTLSDITELADRYDIRVLIADGSGVLYYTSSDMYTLFETNYALPAYYRQAVKQPEGFTIITEGDARKEEIPDFQQNSGNGQAGSNEIPLLDANRVSMTSCKIVQIGGSSYLAILTTLLTPVESTEETIRFILIVISAFMLLVAVGSGVLLSMSLSKPLEDISSCAGKLAKSDYTVQFHEKGPREIRELATTLNYACTELEKTEKLQHELVANVSHDLRTPLTMIKGYAEVMRDIPGENTPENLQIIIDETERLSGLVNDLLDVSRMQANVAALNRRRYSLTESIRTVLKRYNKLTENEGYRILFSETEEVYTEADEDKIYQVLYNLINNAINYTGDSKQIEVIQTVEGDRVRISVRDFGVGISEEELPHIFERYYRSAELHKIAKIGSGLGLSIVKQVLELHGAAYGVESEVGSGTTFWFELPVVRGEKEHERPLD